MADQHGTGSPENLIAHLSYEAFRWGELRRGSREQFQASGFGVGRPFPGEPGANKRQMTIVDPFGLTCRVSLEEDGLYAARSLYRDPPRVEYRPVAADDELPSYVRERNHRALAAGVLITRARVSDKTCTHWYEGTVEQLLAGGFKAYETEGSRGYRHRRKCALGSQVEVFSPLRRFGRGRRLGQVKPIGCGRYRVVLANEEIAADRLIAPGVRRSVRTSEDGQEIVYWGAAAALKATGEIPRAVFEDGVIHVEGMAKNFASVRWQADEAPDGLLVVTHHADVEARLAAEARSRLPVIEGAAAVRDQLGFAIRLASAVLASPIESRDGSVWRLSADSQKSVELALQMARCAIEAATVVVDGRQASIVPADRLAAAQGDADLQAMLRSLTALPIDQAGRAEPRGRR